MSSDRKDARWQLAYQMLEGTPYEEELSKLPYPLQERILLTGQALLEHCADPDLDRTLAVKFRGEQ